jgi:hypothetical protein
MASMKTLTREQAEQKRQKAIEFLRRVGNDERADEFDDMTVDQYAEHRGVKLSNHPRKEETKMATKASLWKQKAEDFQSENDELRDRLDEYEARFDDIASSLPELEEAEEPEEEDSEDSDEA